MLKVAGGAPAVARYAEGGRRIKGHGGTGLDLTRAQAERVFPDSAEAAGRYDLLR